MSFRTLPFDSIFYGRPGLVNFRGRVMAGWEVNYYFIAMAMAHQGYSWDMAEDMIWTWNTLQGIGVIPGGGDMTDEMWFAAREGFDDEIARLPSPAPSRAPHPFPVHGCFRQDMRVSYADQSERAIADVRIGDVLLGWSEHHGELTSGTVTKIHRFEPQPLLQFRLDSGRELFVTPSHPLFVSGSWPREWPAGCGRQLGNTSRRPPSVRQHRGD